MSIGPAGDSYVAHAIRLRCVGKKRLDFAHNGLRITKYISTAVPDKSAAVICCAVDIVILDNPLDFVPERLLRGVVRLL
jgi:hypothetical protein